MPRRQPSQSSPADIQTSPPTVSILPHHTIAIKDSFTEDRGVQQPLQALLGGNPQFADHFFGEPANMARLLRPATAHEDAENGDESIVSAQSGRGRDDASRDGPSQCARHEQTPNLRVPGAAGHSYLDIEATPISIDHLVIQQLHEDLEAYRYDLDFARTQLEPLNAATLTPAEARTFQLRILDLGHQMRMLNHRIQLMQATMNNTRFAGSLAGRAGAAASNAYWGPYPPGTTLQPSTNGAGAGTGAVPVVNGYYGPGAGSGVSAAQSSAVFPGYADYSHERRGPGRPLGSKNRPRPSQDPQQPPVVSGHGSAKAAALATAGAKRDHASEMIRVATPNGDSSGFNAAADESLGEYPTKRMRLDVDVDSPMNNNPETDDRPSHSVITAASNNASFHQESQEGLTDDEMQLHTTFGHTPRGHRPSVSSAMRPTPSGLAAPYGTPSAPLVPALPAGPPQYDGPAGNEFKRLGGWRCRLCTSQKYLNAPPPKQPSEPGHWPLRDISKMVTHFTRMHGEHNNVERCMELGAALGANRGPFRHWLQITKKEKGIDHDAIDTAVDELENGRMPAVLRKVSTSAANFPRD